MQKLIVILGPTASGKTSLSIKLALRLRSGLTKTDYKGVEIISADSRQIYKRLRIGSGVVTKKETQGIKHHLIEFLDPKKTFSAGEFKKLARKKIKDIEKRRKLPFIVGGTGFYIDAVAKNPLLSETKVNKKLRIRLETKTPEELFKIMKKLDPKRAVNIDPHNSRRLIRAIEIAYHAKASNRDQTSRPSSFVNHENHAILYIGVKKSVHKLKQDIETRFIQWLEAGFLKETEKLIKLGLSSKKFKELGLHYWCGYLFLKNKIDFEEFYKKSLFSLWHYAKRQNTWFKKNKKIRWVENEKQAGKLIKNFLEK